MSHTCHDQRYGPRSDTLADAQEQKIFNSVILTYPTEDQTGRRTAPPRQETPGPANWIRDHQRRSSHITTTREDQKNYHPLHTEHDLTLYKEATALCQTRSITCPWSLMQFGFVMFAKRFIFSYFFFVFIVHHIYMLINKYKTYKVYQSHWNGPYSDT